MKRLIDDKEATAARINQLIWGAFHRRDPGSVEEDVDACIKELYAPIPEWYESLDHSDKETWVLCFVHDESDESSERRRYAEWVVEYNGEFVYPFKTCCGSSYGYATPVDLNIRYKGEE